MNSNKIFPVILHPTEGVSPVLPNESNNRRHRVGASELVAFSHIFGLGLKDLQEGIGVKIGKHNYEPDLAYINKEKGIFIDIEIDEPYSGSGPTHYLLADGSNKDAARNKHFQDAGWYVVRFTEEQLFCHYKECMREVYKILLQTGAIDELPKVLTSVPDLDPTPRWTDQDSWRMKRNNYRRTYLGFNPLNMDFASIVRCCQLILPIMWHSIWSSKVRKMMCKQLWNYFIKRK